MPPGCRNPGILLLPPWPVIRNKQAALIGISVRSLSLFLTDVLYQFKRHRRHLSGRCTSKSLVTLAVICSHSVVLTDWRQFPNGEYGECHSCPPPQRWHSFVQFLIMCKEVRIGNFCFGAFVVVLWGFFSFCLFFSHLPPLFLSLILCLPVLSHWLSFSYLKFWIVRVQWMYEGTQSTHK